jgi:hypothetical protein
MIKFIYRFSLTLLILMLITSAIHHFYDTPFGSTDFFKNHGYFFLIFITIFPRLTLLFSSVPFGGFFWWLGLIFAPRILVATLGTMSYMKTNPFLVVVSWMIALGGEFLEKRTIGRRSFFFHVSRFKSPQSESKIKTDEAIETEAKVL